MPASVSVCLPARNEAATIAAIVQEAVRLAVVSEVVVLDDGSTDDTAAIARAAGARVVSEASLLPEAGPGSGKGNAMWKSLHACTGDIICWIDADLRNFRGEYIERLCAPLLAQPETMFVKAYFTRSFEGAPTGGGRVTELVARPLLSLLFPKLADIVQPLGGEYAARREHSKCCPSSKVGVWSSDSSSMSSNDSGATRSRRSISTRASTAIARWRSSDLKRSR